MIKYRVYSYDSEEVVLYHDVIDGEEGMPLFPGAAFHGEFESVEAALHECNLINSKWIKT